MPTFSLVPETHSSEMSPTTYQSTLVSVPNLILAVGSCQWPNPPAGPSSPAAAAPAVGVGRIRRHSAAIERYGSSEYESLLGRGRGRTSIRRRCERRGHRSFGNLRPRGRSRPRLLPSNASSSPECRLIIRCPSGAQEGGARRRLRLPDFPGFGPHSLRRPNITWRQKVGGSIEASKIAGHANTKITEEYTIVQLKRQNELTRRRTDAPDSG